MPIAAFIIHNAICVSQADTQDLVADCGLRGCQDTTWQKGGGLDACVPVVSPI